MARSWSFADDRRVIELAKASKSLEEVARNMKRTPERIRIVSIRLGISLKATSARKARQRAQP
jgi:uncharacterized heparinase superfamily protein